MLETYKEIHKTLLSLWNRRYLIIKSFAILSLFSLFLGFVITKQYLVTTTLLIQNPELTNPFMKDMRINLELQKKVSDLNAQLHSYPVLEKIAKKLNLLKKDMSPKELQSFYKKLTNRLSLSIVDNTTGKKEIDVLQEKNLILLEYRSLSKSNALKELNLITKILIEDVFLPISPSSKDSEQFFQEQLLTKKKQLTEAEQRLSKFTTNNAGTLPSLHIINLERLRTTQQALMTKEAELGAAKADLILQQHNLIQLTPELSDLDEQITKIQFDIALLREKNLGEDILAKRQNKLNQLTIEREEKLFEARKVNINALESIQGQVANLSTNGVSLPQSFLLNQLKNYQTAYLKVTDLTREIQNLQDQMKNLEPTLNDFGERDKTLAELTTEVSMKRDLYQNLLDRYQKTQDKKLLDQYISHEQVKVIDSPFQIPTPIGFSKKLFLLLGIISGGLLGISLALLLDFIDGTVRFREQIENKFGVPVLARIPNLMNS